MQKTWFRGGFPEEKELELPKGQGTKYKRMAKSLGERHKVQHKTAS